MALAGGVTIPLKKLTPGEDRMELGWILCEQVEQGVSNRMHLNMRRLVLPSDIFPGSHISPNLRATETDHGPDGLTVGQVGEYRKRAPVYGRSDARDVRSFDFFDCCDIKRQRSHLEVVRRTSKFLKDRFHFRV